jgi:hypothetical protein
VLDRLATVTPYSRRTLAAALDLLPPEIGPDGALAVLEEWIAAGLDLADLAGIPAAVQPDPIRFDVITPDAMAAAVERSGGRVPVTAGQGGPVVGSAQVYLDPRGMVRADLCLPTGVLRQLPPPLPDPVPGVREVARRHLP